VAFPRRLLIEGEELVLDIRPHWIALARAALVTLLVVVASIVVAAKVDGAAVWAALVIGALLIAWWPIRDVIRWATSHFVVTSDRVIHREGLIAKSSMEIPLEAINDVRFRQGIFERMIGAGDLIIESAGTRGTETFEDIRHPESVQRTIYEQGERNEQGMRAPSSTSSAPSTTTELERLAQLRDRGVLTEAEFQNQKSKILGS
jgi:uncharacterized membrane protein YdbT with pleckstrin-like domain